MGQWQYLPPRITMMIQWLICIKLLKHGLVCCTASFCFPGIFPLLGFFLYPQGYHTVVLVVETNIAKITQPGSLGFVLNLLLFWFKIPQFHRSGSSSDRLEIVMEFSSIHVIAYSFHSSLVHWVRSSLWREKEKDIQTIAFLWELTK